MTNAPAGAPRLSVCIPCYRADGDLIVAAAQSAAAALRDGCELLVFASGPSTAIVHELPLPAETRIVASDRPLTLVENWNRCLTDTTGSLVHILHSDDLVAAGFYATILDLAERFPQAALYATATGQPGAGAGAELNGADGVHLPPREAAAFFLVDERHSCGNVVLTRRAFEQRGAFDPAFSSCPDEEAYLRYAAAGGLGFSPKPLYLERSHGLQERFSAWQRPEFVDEYFLARMVGARHLDQETEALAVTSTERSIVSVAVALADAGLRPSAEHVLHELTRINADSSRAWRVRLARLACRRPLVLRLLSIRRRVKRLLRGAPG
jgi:hypothetical protein